MHNARGTRTAMILAGIDGMIEQTAPPAVRRQQSMTPANILQLALPELAASTPVEIVLASWSPHEGLRLQQVVALGPELLDEPVRPKKI